MAVHPTSRHQYFLLSSLCLFILSACSYQRPAGKWTTIDASSIYFSGVQLSDEAIDPNYAMVCREARDEIYTQLLQKLPEKIAPLALQTGKIVPAEDTASLKIRIKRCEIDVEQSGDSFTYYLTLPLTVSLTQNHENLLSYDMATYEQANTDTPGPEFEFTFAEPVARTLQLFDGRRLWQPND